MRKLKKILAHVCLLGMAVGLLANVPKQRTEAAGQLTGKTAMQVTSEMGVGFNIGNTLDSSLDGASADMLLNSETLWGNPKITKELMQSLKAKGFSTVRIPTTWYQHLSKDGQYTIDANYLARVKQVVDYAIDSGLYVILNVHHEDWVNVPDISTDYVAIGKELNLVWTQLVDAFADYDQHLIFEGMNEPRAAGLATEWTGTPADYQAINYLNQVFVSTIRCSGKGHNSERCLMIPGYAASSGAAALKAITLPTYNGKVADNLIISVHCYLPSDFCLSTKKTFDPDNAEDTAAVEALFDNLNDLFLSEGIPVVLGEASASDNGNLSYREAWFEYITGKAAAYGTPIVIWDNGVKGAYSGAEGTSSENHAYVDRNSPYDWCYPTLGSAMMTGIKSVPWGSKVGKKTPEKASLAGANLWVSKDGIEASKTWTPVVIIDSEESYFTDGRKVAVVYEGSKAPKLVLASNAYEKYWMLVDSSGTDTLSGGRKVAYFNVSDIRAELAKNGVEDLALVTNLQVIAADSLITVYEITIQGTPCVTYKANGQTYYMGTDLPANPTMKNMKFAGWYTTKNYAEGTEFSLTSLSSDITVYAKFEPDLEALNIEDNAATEEKTTEVGSTEASTEKTTEVGSTEASTEKTTEVGSTEKTTETGSTEKTTEVGSTEKTTETGSTEKTTEVGSTEKTTETGSAEKTTEVGSTEKTTEVGSTEKTTEVGSTEKTTETGSTEKTTEVGSTETGDTGTTTEEGSTETDEEKTTEVGSTETTTEQPTPAKIKVGKAKISKLKSKKKATLTITYKKVSGAKGYRVELSTSKKFKKKIKIFYSGNKKFTKTVKKLKSGKKYYVKVRAYKLDKKKKKVYGKWSAVKSVKVK